MLQFTEKYRQLNLFKWINPFKRKIKTGILEGISNSCGVYRFYDASNTLLYVGKSIQLRTRILSYGRIQPDKDSKRLVRLVSKIDRVETEICENEEKTLLKENEYLRKCKPQFNRANTKHELYVFVGLKKKQDSIEIGWALTEHGSTFDELFGAFKGLASTNRMLMSLYRLHALKSRKRIMHKKYFTKKAPFRIEWKIDDQTNEDSFDFLKDYLSGNRCAINFWLNDLDIKSKFEENVLNESLGVYLNWFQYQALRNKYVREKFNFKNGLITQAGFDDWIVKK
ncbi:MAG: nucleotide excision repair endonuclease [Bacteroidetes bacterium]|nr:nucleotide excision repair endonuclease [Bacteroidota bacterium]NCQ11925.1 nucleotide excision repair endonuclease [Bacteroidota bacterium]